MNISKLILTPSISGSAKIVINNPSKETAALLINEKLLSRYGFQKPKHPKMPACLRGFVNPKTYVGKAVDIYR